MHTADTLLEQRFTILRELGKSTLVVRDRESDSDQELLLRLLHPEDEDPLELEVRLDLERALGISHPAIARVHEVGRLDDGRFFYTQDLVEGTELYQWALTRDPTDVLTVFAQLLDALGAYHAHGLVAGGTRPFHLKIESTPEGPRLRILDPGGLIEEYTRTDPAVAYTMGMAGALAPERRVGAPVDRRANLYEAGQILYELLAGSSDAMQIGDPLSSVEPDADLASLARMAPGLPLDLASFVLVILRPNPDDRPPSVAHTLTALERVCGMRLASDDPAPQRLPLPPPCVGRQLEVSRLIDWGTPILQPPRRPTSGRIRKADATPQTSSLILVEGAPGMGKRTLLDGFALHLGVEGVTVLRGACGQGGQGALGPFGGIFRELLSSPRFRRLMANAPDSTHWALRALLPELAADLPAGPTPPALEDAEGALARLLAALTTHLLEAAQRQPMAILLTDVDLARPPTLALIAHLARSLWVTHLQQHEQALSMQEARPKLLPKLLLVATSTTLQDDWELVGPFAKTLVLGPLAPRDLHAMAAASLDVELCPPELSQVLATQAGGNPSEAMRLVRAYMSGVIPPQPLEPAAAPEPSSEGVLASLRAASKDDQLTFMALAALNRPANASLLAGVTGRAPEEARQAIHHWLSDGVIDRHTGRRYALASSTLGRTCLEHFPELAREVAGRLAKLLAEQVTEGFDTPLEHPLEVVELAARAGLPGPLLRFGQLAVAYLESLSAPERAAGICAAMADHLEEEDGEQAFQLRRQAVENWLRAGEPAKAEELLRAMLDKTGDEHPAGLVAQVWCSLTICLREQDKHPEARTALSWANAFLDDADEGSAIERAQVCALAAEIHLAADEREEAKARSQQGLDGLKGATKSPEAARKRARLLGTLGHLAFLDEDFDEAGQLLKASLALQERDHLREAAARSLQRLGNTAFAAGSIQQAESHWKNSLASWEELGVRRFVAQVVSNLALSAARRGDLNEARQLLRRSLRIRQEDGDHQGTAASLHNLGWVYSCAGALEEAAAAYRECLARRLEQEDRWYGASASNNLGEVLLKLGATETARQYIQQALDARTELGDRRGEAESIANLTRVALRRGQFSLALERLMQAERIRQEVGAPEDRMANLRLEARVLLALGDLKRAKTCVEASLKLTHEHSLSIHEAPNRLLLAVILARSGNRLLARRELDRARRSADQIGDRLTSRSAVIELSALKLATRPMDARALLDSRPVPRPGRLKPLEGRLPVDRKGVLRVRERLLRARIELALESGSVAAAQRAAEESLAEARRGELRDMEWRALQALAACAEIRGAHEAALSLTLEAQEIVEHLHGRVPQPNRDGYLAADPLRAAALRGDSPVKVLEVKAKAGSDVGEVRPPDADSGRLLVAMVQSTLPTIQPARSGPPTPPGATGRPSPPPPGPPSTVAGGVQSDDFASIVRLNRLIVDEPDLPKTLEAIVAKAVELCGAERGFLALFGETPDDLHVLATDGIDDVERPRQRFFRHCAAKAAATGQLVLSAEARVDPAVKLQAHVMGLGLRSVMAAPVTVPDGRRGSLYLDGAFQIGRFTDREVDLLEAIADQCAIAIGRGALEAALHERRGIPPGAQREYLQAKAMRERPPLVHLGDPARGLVGRSEAMRAAIDTLRQVAERTVSVLIEGPPGVGKGVAARALHEASGRSGPLVVADLRQLPLDLVEDELFGHVSGAFAGASGERAGLFREAQGGTLLLEHVDEAPPEVQAKLVQAIEERQVRPLGADALIPFDARIVATVGKDPHESQSDGRLREDLLLLVGETHVVIPSLDERSEDKGPLIDALLASWEREGRPLTLSSRARAVLEGRSYRGNARELNATIAAAAAVGGDRPVQEDDLPSERSTKTPGLRASLADYERTFIQKALLREHGDLTATARVLGITRRALKRKIEQFEIAP